MKAFRLSRAVAVLAEYGPAGVHVSEACRRLGIPLVVHFHGYDASRLDVLQAHLQNYPRLFNQAAAIIAVSRAMQSRIISLGADPLKVHNNPCGVDCEMFSCGDPGSAPPSLLAVGRFVEKKAPHLTLLAFAEARRQCRDARLRMIGTGPLWGPCRDLAIALGLGDSVTFLGAQAHSVVQKEMGHARAFIQHSVESSSGECEGTPVALLEAGASGLPVLSTYHAGIPDVVIHGETGYLVAERDVSGMAEYMVKVLQQSSIAQQLGQAARRRIEARFRMETSIQQLWAIIESCIMRPSNAIS
jgi:glycosyltransferase involved in cell wall biosynthesis